MRGGRKEKAMARDFSDYVDPTENDPGYIKYINEQLFGMWLENVKKWPKIFNFIYEGACNGRYHDPKYCSGLLNACGMCQMCQEALNDAIEAAEYAAGWSSNA